MCYFNNQQVWLSKLIEILCSNRINQTNRWYTIQVAIRSLHSTKSPYKKLKFKIGHYYVIAATKWLKEKGYISTRKEGHKKLLIPTRDYKLLAFLMALDDLMSDDATASEDSKFIDILKTDMSDLFTRGLNVGSFLVSILCSSNKTCRERFFTIVSSYPEVKEELLKIMAEKAEVYELGAKKIRGMMEKLEKIVECPPYSVTV